MDWLERLRAEIKATSITEVARKVGMSRATISLVASGKYPADPSQVYRRIKATFESVACSVPQKPDLQWLERLKSEVTETSITQVARTVGVSTATISYLVNGKYRYNPARVLARVEAAYSKVACPFLSETIDLKKCRQYATRDFPTSNPYQVRFYRACRSCPNRPKESK